MKIIFLLTFVSRLALSATDPCKEWFDKADLKKDMSCIMKCSVLSTNMGTFHCPALCQDLCRENKKTSNYSQKKLERFVYYPGLTNDEKDLVRQSPKDAWIVFEQKNIAEESTERNFPDGDLNDESDAFRHFIWAGLLFKELGLEKAKQFLDAHENDPKQPPSEKAMDLANNRDGLLVAQKLIKNNKLDLKTLEREALKELIERRLTILNPRLKIPREPK